MDTSPKDNPWDAGRIVHEMMALWFGSIHGLSIVRKILKPLDVHLADESIVPKTTTYALFDLCRHPEYVEPLRKELKGPEYHKFVATTDGLPLLDSFVKESARMHPIDSSMFTQHPPLYINTKI